MLADYVVLLCVASVSAVAGWFAEMKLPRTRTAWVARFILTGLPLLLLFLWGLGEEWVQYDGCCYDYDYKGFVADRWPCSFIERVRNGTPIVVLVGYFVVYLFSLSCYVLSSWITVVMARRALRG